jgi:hypothetical protein
VTAQRAFFGDGHNAARSATKVATIVRVEESVRAYALHSCCAALTVRFFLPSAIAIRSQKSLNLIE